MFQQNESRKILDCLITVTQLEYKNVELNLQVLEFPNLVNSIPRRFVPVQDGGIMVLYSIVQNIA
jgi:hypothetical protein